MLCWLWVSALLLNLVYSNEMMRGAVSSLGWLLGSFRGRHGLSLIMGTKPGWVGRGAPWCRGRCPCLLQGGAGTR